MFRLAALAAPASAGTLVAVVSVGLIWASSGQDDRDLATGSTLHAPVSDSSASGADLAPNDVSDFPLVSGRGRVIKKNGPEASTGDGSDAASTGSPPQPAPSGHDKVREARPATTTSDTGATTAGDTDGTGGAPAPAPAPGTMNGDEVEPAPAFGPAAAARRSPATPPAPIPTPANRPVTPNPGPGGGNPAQDFTIAGSYAGLYPGVSRSLILSITNPNAFPIDVTSLTATVSLVSGPRVMHEPSCRPEDLDVAQYAGGLSVPARGMNTTMIDLMLLPSAPDACQGASFALTYAGEAVQQ